uniref:Uncharacterized protein n=1 Tax=Branchiostoma floridae TaxID=7739 RepID=C3ZSM2_BRAFL|eukprot:XP_002588413.1 hypothetical protein BRAFLDRAFT_63362 [Branchiostoma floridae]
MAVNLYCKADEMPVCALCKLVGKHQGHEVAALSDAYKEKKDVLIQEVSVLKDRNKEISQFVDGMRETCVKVQEEEEKLKLLKEEITKKEEHLQKAQAVVAYVEEVLKEKDQSCFLQAVKSTRDRVEKSHDRDELTAPADWMFKGFDLSRAAKELQAIDLCVVRTEASQDNFRLRSEFTKAMEDNARSVENLESELASLRAEVQQLRDIKSDHMKDVPISQECRSYATVLSQDKSAPPPTPRLTRKQRQLTVVPTTTLASSPARLSVTDDNSGFTQVRRRRRGKAIVGRASNKGSLVVAKPRPVEVFVSRLSVETSAESLTQFLHDNEMEPIDCEKLVTRFGSYASFKLVIGKADSEKILSPDFWPSGILEHWLLPQDLHLLSELDDDYLAFGTSPVNTEEGILQGRPYGGVAVLWRQNIGLEECVQALSASSYLREYIQQYRRHGGYNYQNQYSHHNENNLIDGRTDTYWHSNSGHEDQHWLRLQLMPGVQARSLRLTFVPQPPGKWTENHRPKKVTVLTGDDFDNMAALETVRVGGEQREITLNIDAEKPFVQLTFQMKAPSDCIVSQLSIVASKPKAQ